MEADHQRIIGGFRKKSYVRLERKDANLQRIKMKDENRNSGEKDLYIG